MEYLIIIIIILIFGSCIIYLKLSNDRQQRMLKELLNEQKDRQNEQLQALKDNMHQNLYSFEHSLINSLKQDMHNLNNTTYERLMTIENRVHNGMQVNLEKTSQSFNALIKQMTKIDQAQESLRDLSSNISALQNVLIDKKTRGTWGEIELYSLLEQIYGDNQHQFMKQYRLSNGNIVDAVLFAQKPLGIICIDSKFPLENFNRMADEHLRKDELLKAKLNFKKDIIKHIDDIASKYLIPDETAEIAYMFVPAEAIFAKIYGQFDDVVQYAFKQHVFIVSPTTLMAYITAIKAIYLEQKRSEKVIAIQNEFHKLAKEFDRFVQRYDTISRDFEKTYKDLHDLTITSEKIVGNFRRIEQVQLKEEDKDVQE
ncbi:MAG: DNA recombination protein RmuC [Erysipelotrichaceae bacterium]|nr:DNA recombination protein RmuC [Erysipelotrichaceae bacterium]MDY5251306.1 DNA recombination protein RmuC [Erysipelotrichaceae bacterium]